MSNTQPANPEHTPANLIGQIASLKAQNEALKSELQRCHLVIEAFTKRAKNDSVGFVR